MTTFEFEDSEEARLDWPEDYLWVRHSDGATTITEKRLHELYSGTVAPEDETEKMLVDNPEWLRAYLTHAIGEVCVFIKAGAPLPDWNGEWRDSLE